MVKEEGEERTEVKQSRIDKRTVCEERRIGWSDLQLFDFRK